MKEKYPLKAKTRSQLDPCIFNKSAVSLLYHSLRIMTIKKCAKGTKGFMNPPQAPELKHSKVNELEKYGCFFFSSLLNIFRQIFRNYGELDNSLCCR